MEDERSLIAMAQKGDPDAFALLYDKYVDAIYRYIAVRVSAPELVEDLTEDVFLKAWQALRRYRPKQPFLHWLYRIAHNRVVDEYRRKANQDISLDTLLEDGNQMAADASEPLQSALVQENRQALQQALSTLSPEEQTLLTLRFVEDISHREIAKILNKSEGACRILQHRALKKLAQRLNLYSEALP